MHSSTSPAGGGTKAALPWRVPPIQFWLRRNSPGVSVLPRPLASSTPCTSRISRSDSGVWRNC
ncbi:MAG: hypothetical protein CALGDGBN_01981 [Pseudomonadales bacterium]|nr:hypothetical protein [Pseudomonadales bacterium]